MPSFATRPPIRRRGQNWLPLSRSSTRADRTGAGGVVLGGSADIDLSVPAVPSNVDFLWDFDNDGDFDQPVETFTDYVMAANSLIGRDFPSQLNGRASPGRLRITVNNDDDRFSYFNTSSPLATAPFSLRTGRKIRVAATGTAHPDPALLVRDRFDRATFAAGTETGQTWTQPHSSWATEATTDADTGGANTTMPGQLHTAIVDTGSTDYYVQARLVEVGRLTTSVASSVASIIYRWQDADNYSALRLDVATGVLSLVNVVAAVETPIDTAGSVVRDNMTLGVHVAGAVVRAYEDGVHIMSDTAIQLDETEVGFSATWASGQPAVVFDDFYVWDGLPVETEGILWTGTVEKVTPSVTAGPYKVAVIEAIGELARAATYKTVPSPVVFGRQTGSQVGNVLANAGLLLPPGPSGSITPGIVTTGPHAYADEVTALEASRRLEDIEVGFLHETQEGYLAYLSRNTRDSEVSAVTFSDDPGSQFAYTRLVPYDWEREVVNQAAGQLAQQHPALAAIYTSARTTAAGTANPVVLPVDSLVEDGDIQVIVIASAVPSDDEDWVTPLWWVPYRDIRARYALRVYAHISDGADGGEIVTFYNDAAANGGAWFARSFLFRDWYGTHEGLEVSEAHKGSSPIAFLPRWGLSPTTFIAVRYGSVAGGSITTESYPIGYTQGETDIQGATSPLRDVALQTAVKSDIVTVEDPGGFTGFGGFVGPNSLVETLTIAVRGINGSAPPPESGGVVVTGNDADSQREHNAIRPAQQIPNLFNSTDDAEDYIDFVLARHADDRPIFALTFVPTAGNHYRAQALRRRVNDRITLVAENNSGMGVSGDFFIESIAHTWAQGTAWWETTWELSPVDA